MEGIKGNKVILILLLIILYLYILMAVVGCETQPVGERYMWNNDLDVSLVCEDFKEEPFLELGKKGIMDAKEEVGVKPNIVLLNLNDTDKQVNAVMNKTAINNNLVIILGGWLKNAVKVSSRQLRARNFVVIDEVLNEPNVKSIIYKSEEGAFLMGIIAGKETKKDNVGFIGGLNDDEGASFLSGYISGIKISNEKAFGNIMRDVNIDYTEDFKDENKAYVKAKELYGSGCDIIFHACGAAGKGVFRAAKETGNKALGVDVNSSAVYPEYKEVIISSMIKKIDKSVVDVCAEIKEGNFKAGIKNLKEVGIKEGYIDYSEDTKENVSKETFDFLNKYKIEVKEGVLKIPDKLFQVAEFNS
ncbi:MAG: BMP family ABC transporter substrate-binding protein [Clostridium sp.]|uniref:BMP family ABC transporter substrate-binding protein n=1 Tax=Clostridium sp. TaxID=1506 RepID=UPI003F40031C